MENRAQRARRIRQQRLKAATGAVLVVALITTIVVVAWPGSKSPSPVRSDSTNTSRPVHRVGPDSIEAGVESWQYPVPVSRETVVAGSNGLTVLGGLTPSGSSLPSVSTIDPVGLGHRFRIAGRPGARRRGHGHRSLDLRPRRGIARHRGHRPVVPLRSRSTGRRRCDRQPPAPAAIGPGRGRHHPPAIAHSPLTSSAVMTAPPTCPAYWPR